MTAALSHDAHTEKQFGARAADYVASAVHAAGEDLAALARVGALPHFAVLDLGCGGGHVTYAVAPHVRAVTALDLSQAMLDAVSAEARRRGLTNVTTRQASVEALPFADASFDCVLSRYSAHHWADVPAALREAHRVLAPSRWLLFLFPTLLPVLYAAFFTRTWQVAPFSILFTLDCVIIAVLLLTMAAAGHEQTAWRRRHIRPPVTPADGGASRR